MPVVRYAREQQGYRVFTNPNRALHGLGADPNCTAGMPYDVNGNLCAGVDPNCANLMPYDVNGNPCPGTGPVPVQPSGTGTPVTPGPTVVAPQQAGPSTPAGAPTGSYLLYVGNWAVTLSQSMNSIIAAVRSAVAGYGLQITNVNCPACSSVSPSSILASMGVQSFQVQLQILVTGQGFAQPSDAGSIVDHAFYTVAGKMPTSSSTSVQQLPGAGAGAPPGAPGTSLTAWFEQNAMWIGIGILAIAVVPNLIRRL